MSRLSVITERGHKVLEAMDGEDVVFKGNTMPALVSDIRTDRGESKAGGYAETIDGNVSIRRSLFETKPVAGETIIIRGTIYFIGAVDEDSAAYEFPVSTHSHD